MNLTKFYLEGIKFSSYKSSLKIVKCRVTKLRTFKEPITKVS